MGVTELVGDIVDNPAVEKDTALCDDYKVDLTRAVDAAFKGTRHSSLEDLLKQAPFDLRCVLLQSAHVNTDLYTTLFHALRPHIGLGHLTSLTTMNAALEAKNKVSSGETGRIFSKEHCGVCRVCGRRPRHPVILPTTQPLVAVLPARCPGLPGTHKASLPSVADPKLGVHPTARSDLWCKMGAGSDFRRKMVACSDLECKMKAYGFGPKAFREDLCGSNKFRQQVVRDDGATCYPSTGKQQSP
jgi:hypothetical protein